MTALERMLELGWSLNKNNPSKILDFYGQHTMNVGGGSYRWSVYYGDILMDAHPEFPDFNFSHAYKHAEALISSTCVLMIDGIK